MAAFRKGQILGGRFEIVGLLGHGGTAAVYLARDRLRGGSVALKVLHGHLAGSASVRARLRRRSAPPSGSRGSSPRCSARLMPWGSSTAK